MNSAQKLNSKLHCYLNQDARAAMDKLVFLGVDEDLAFTLVETLGGESVYELDRGLEDDGDE